MASQFIELPIPGSSGGSGGDASAANQVIANGLLADVEANTDATSSKLTTTNTILTDVDLAVNSIDSKIPSNPAVDRILATAPSAMRLSDGAAFYKATTPSDDQPIIAKARHPR